METSNVQLYNISIQSEIRQVWGTFAICHISTIRVPYKLGMQHVIVTQTHNQVNKLKVKLPAQQKQYQQELFNPYTYTKNCSFIYQYCAQE